MAEGYNYHRFSDHDEAPEQEDYTTARGGGFSIKVGGLGEVHFHEDAATQGSIKDEVKDDSSSMDENYDVASITSSIEDHLM